VRKLTILILALFITACAAQSPSLQRASEAESTPLAQTNADLPREVVLASPTQPVPTQTLSGANEPLLTPSLVPSSSASVPTPSETPLPPLELPTPLENAPARLAWDGEPTYPGDSKPGYSFRVMYDPDVWALTTNSYGYPAIGHRGIEYCVIAPAFGGGLPANITVDHDVRKIGLVEYEINTAYLSGVRQFVTYLGGDANIYTGFEVTFDDEADLCLKEAEVVLGTFTSVLTSRATPVP
jgi:hypothetical protein